MDLELEKDIDQTTTHFISNLQGGYSQQVEMQSVMYRETASYDES